MPHISVSDYLYVAQARDEWPRLMALSTFRRKGRLRSGQKRTVHYYKVLKDGRLVLPRGLFARVRKVLPTASVADGRFLAKPVDFGFRWELRDYQDAAVKAVLHQGEGVVVSPPASGKTVMGLAIAAAWQQPTLFLVHTLRLVDQTKEKAREVLTLPRGALGVVADSAKQYGTHLTIATIQTLAKKPRYVRELAQRVGTVIVDECHHSPSESFQKVVNAFPAKYRAGLSATPDRGDGLGPVITALLGPRVVIPRKILRDRGVIMDPLVYVVETAWVAPAEGSYDQSEKARAADPLRNALIARVVWNARRRQQRVLVLVELERHAFALANILSKAGMPAYPVVGRLSKGVQDQRFLAMEEGKAVVVATKLANEGLDWPALDCLVMATPGRSATILEQRTGRIARMAPGKQLAVVYDMVDHLSPVYWAQYQARLSTYRTMGYRVRRWAPRGEE